MVNGRFLLNQQNLLNDNHQYLVNKILYYLVFFVYWVVMH